MKSVPGLAVLFALAACAGPKAELSESNEYFVGRAAAAEVLNSYNVIEDEPLIGYLTEIGYVMIRASERPETYRGYHFAVLDTEEINAYTAPSGFIFVTRGILKRCQSEDELAAVLAHEIGHAVRKHPELQARQAMQSSRWAEAASFLSEIFKKIDDSQEWANAMNLFEDVFKAAAKGWSDGYGSDQELEADREGARLLARVGYDPHALATILARTHHTDGKGWNADSYPPTLRRIAEVEKTIREDNLQGTVDPARTARFKRITAKVRGETP